MNEMADALTRENNVGDGARQCWRITGQYCGQWERSVKQVHAQQLPILCVGPVELPPFTQIPRCWHELLPEN